MPNIKLTKEDMMKIFDIESPAYKELCVVAEQISKLSKIPKSKFTEANHRELSRLLAKRVELLNNVNVNIIM